MPLDPRAEAVKCPTDALASTEPKLLSALDSLSLDKATALEADAAEWILDSSHDRFILFPIKHKDTFDFYLQQVASFWTVNEVDLAQDRIDFRDKLTAAEQEFVGMVLAFFAASDGIVNENLAARFAQEVQVPEVRTFYEFQIGIETIHKHMYGLMIDTLITDEDQRARFFNAITDVPCVKAKADWALRWLSETASFSERLIAFACVEGIFFSASFCAIYYFKKRSTSTMPGLTFSNELISRDEGMHADFACHVYERFIQRKLPEARVHAIVRSAVNCESQFVRDALHVDLVGMNERLMLQYVKFVADRLVVSLGYQKLYKVDNPFDWMDLISLSGKTNFFEKRVGEYQKAGVMGEDQKNFELVDDF